MQNPSYKSPKHVIILRIILESDRLHKGLSLTPGLPASNPRSCVNITRENVGFLMELVSKLWDAPPGGVIPGKLYSKNLIDYNS